MHFRAVLNRDGGTLRTMDLSALQAHAEAVFAEHGHYLDCRIVAGDRVVDELEAAATDESVDVILAGGGDGTISSAAAIAFRRNKPLAVLPAGTMNLFARSLHMPLDVEAALSAIAGGHIQHVDIGTVNGRPFVHQFGVGIHARLVRIREGMVYRSRVGKMLASLRAIGTAAIDPPQFEVEIIRQGVAERSTVTGIAISNNPLNNAPVPTAVSLDTGLFGVYVAAALTTRELLNLVVDVFTGRWRSNAAVSETEVSELVLRFPSRKGDTYAVIDGELVELDKVVSFRMHKGGLAMIRPALAAKASAGPV